MEAGILSNKYTDFASNRKLDVNCKYSAIIIGKFSSNPL